MTKAPTLIDMVLRETFKRDGHIPSAYRDRLIRARRFVLDEKMSEFLADLSFGCFNKGNKHIPRIVEGMRTLSRLPHAITWVEYFPRYTRQRAYDLGLYDKIDLEQMVPKCGWLLEQHPTDEQSFKATLFDELVRRGGLNANVVMLPFSYGWSTDERPPIWKNESKGGLESYAIGLDKYQPRFTTVMRVEDHPRTLSDDDIAELTAETAGELRRIWALLSTINELPVRIEPVKQHRGFVARGQYRKFLDHSIVRIIIPGRRTPQQVARAAITLSRRRAHMVRGHWRKSEKEGRIWIREHQRGDATLGWVTHDYVVEHNKEDA